MLDQTKMKALSTGLNGACQECEDNNDLGRYETDECGNEAIDEGFFSNHPCILCDGLAGLRFAAHYLDENGELNHIDVCTECVERIN